MLDPDHLYLMTVDYYLKSPEEQNVASGYDFNSEYGVNYRWIKAFPNPTKSQGYLKGQPLRIYFPPNESNVFLFLGLRCESKLPEEPISQKELNENLLELIRKFELRDANLDSDFVTIQFHISDDKTRLLLSSDDNIDIIEIEDDSSLINLPDQFPSPLIKKFFPFNILWVFDGTLSISAFQKCKDSASLLLNMFSNETKIKTSFVFFGEYKELWAWRNAPAPYGAYEIWPDKILFSSSNNVPHKVFQQGPLPSLKRDDPAAAIELTFKAIADSLENPNWSINPLFIILMGNSLPHYNIDELIERKINIIPSEEFKDIRWKSELNRIKKHAPYVLPVWIFDETLDKKWPTNHKSDLRQGFNEAQNWWCAALSDELQCIMTDASTTSRGLSRNVYNIITSSINSYLSPSTKIRLPLYKSAKDFTDNMEAIINK